MKAEFKAGELVRIGVEAHAARRGADRQYALGKLGLFMGYDEWTWAPFTMARVLIDRNEYFVAPEGLEKVQ